MKKQQLSIAKITRPVLCDVVKRKNLFSLVDEFRSKSVIWISGAAGSGKTSFVSSYLSSKKLSNIWYHVDEGDSDPTTFFHYMSLAGKKAAPRRKKGLPHLTPEYMMGLPTFTRRFFEELYGRLKPPFCIVLDNFQNLHEDSPLHDLLAIGLTEVPEGGCVILVSRSGPPKQYSRFKANGMMAVIGRKDLMLSPDESSEIVKLRGDGLDDKTVHTLHEKAGGWAAGLVLLTEKVKNSGIESIDKGVSTHKDLFDYFMNEVFDKSNIETQNFLLKSSLLPKMTSHMVEKVTDSKKAARTLSKFARNNYFTNRRPGRESVYQYHDLFREFLLIRLTEHFSATDIIKLKQVAGSALDEAGCIEDAATLYLESEDWESLSVLVQRNAQDFLIQGRNSMPEGWVKSMPREVVDTNPWLIYWLGTFYMPMNIAEARCRFERAFKLFESLKDPAGIYLSWSGVIMAIFYSFDNFYEFDRWIKIFGKLERSYPFPSAEIDALITKSILQYLTFRNPAYPDANKWLKRARALSLGNGPVSLRAEVAYMVVFHSVTIGAPEMTENLIEEIKEAADSTDVTPLSMITIKLTGAWHNWSSACVEESLGLITEGLAISEKSGVRVMDYNLLGGGAANTLVTGDLAGAEAYIGKMSNVMNGGNRLNVSFYHILSAWHALLKGELLKAYRLLKESREIVESTGVPFAIAFNIFGTSQVLFERGQKRQAATELAAVRRIGRNINNHLIEYMCLLGKARFALESGKDSVGLKALKKALALGRTHKVGYYYFFQPDVMVRLYTRALEEGINVEYVQEMIRRYNLVPDPPPIDCERWPWPIRIYNFGRFSLLKDGKPLQTARKSQQKPLELLKAIITFGGRDVGEEQLTDALWPEAEGDAAHSVFSVTLVRLRKLLGTDGAIQLSEGRVTLNPRYCWVDTWAFERILNRSQGKAGKKSVKAELIEKGLSLYTAPFLAGEVDKPWLMLFRERLRNKFLRYTGELGHLYEETEQCQKAVASFKKCLDVDNMSEESSQHLMLCYKRLGRSAEAVAVYRRLKKVLSATLGAEPSPKTEKIYKSILAK